MSDNLDLWHMIASKDAVILQLRDNHELVEEQLRETLNCWDGADDLREGIIEALRLLHSLDN